MPKQRTTAERIVWQATESVPLIRIGTGGHVTAFFGGLNVAYYMHWVPHQNRTMPCVLGRCIACEDGSPRRPLSYSEGMTYRLRGTEHHWLPAIIELPYTSWKAVEFIGPEVICLRREKDCGPVNVGKFMFAFPPPGQIRFALVENLLRMWHLPPKTPLAMVGNLGPNND